MSIPGLPNPWIILAVVLLFGAGCGYSYYAGGQHKENEIAAQMKRDDELLEKMTNAALNGAAQAIAKIKVKNVTNQQTLEKEIVRVTDYVNCNHSDDGLRALNNALTNSQQPADSSVVPGPDAPSR